MVASAWPHRLGRQSRSVCCKTWNPADTWRFQHLKGDRAPQMTSEPCVPCFVGSPTQSSINPDPKCWKSTLETSKHPVSNLYETCMLQLAGDVATSSLMNPKLRQSTLQSLSLSHPVPSLFWASNPNNLEPDLRFAGSTSPQQLRLRPEQRSEGVAESNRRTVRPARRGRSLCIMHFHHVFGVLSRVFFYFRR